MQSLNILFGLLAVLGLILFGVGRWMMIAAAGEMNLLWKLALRCLPFADLLFLSRYWDTAKNGAFTSLIGLALLLPWAGKEIYEKNHRAGDQPPLGLDMDTKAGIYGSMKMHHDWCIEAKAQKFAQLNARMSAWYQALQTRRAAMGNNATREQLAAFNEEAAAYQALREVTKTESAELNVLRSQPYEFKDIKNEDYIAWMRQMPEKFAAGGSGVSPMKRSMLSQQ